MSQDLSILIVDDAKFSSAVVSRTLTAAGFTDIRHASSAVEGLEKLEERAAAIVIADWLMPEVDGLELTRRVRQLDEQVNRYTYIILLTAREGVPALQKAFDEGVDDFVNKSSMNDQLVPRVLAAQRIANIYNRALVENQRLIEANARLRQNSTLDPLTGFGNRQYAIKRLEDALRQAHQRGGGACLLVMRIEDYKRLEAEQGRVLTQLVLAMSRRLKQLVRPMDVLARISPELFVLVTWQEDLQNCVPASFKRLYEGLNHKAYKTAAGFLQASVSVSLSTASDKDDIAADLLLKRCMRGLDTSANSGRIIEQPVSG